MLKVLQLGDTLPSADWTVPLYIDLDNSEKIGFIQALSQKEVLVFIDPNYKDHIIYKTLDDLFYPEIRIHVYRLWNQILVNMEFDNLENII